jgi:hypothetical protein
MSANTDFKTSLLVGRQLPEFVRDEYPTFVTFLEAYYEFLEKKQGTQKNDLVNAAKSLRDIRDVDSSIAEFETNFYNTYASLIPIEVQSDKALLFKHLVPLYRSKGSDASFKLLFRLVFGEDIDLILPKNNVLKASGSKWQIDNKLRINAQISSRYVGNGSTKIFNLAQVSTANQITVYVDGIEKNLTTDFFLKVEYRQLIFKTAPTNNSVITVEYSQFDPALLYNRKVTGLTSGASAIIESTNRRIISDSLNLGLPIELVVNANSLDGNFLNGENVSIPILDSNEILIDIRASTFSIVRAIDIINGGVNYNVGDVIVVSGGGSTESATIRVEDVFRGTIDRILVHHGGAVFTYGSDVRVSGNGSSVLTLVVDGVDTSGANASNTFIISTDTISNFNGSVHAANSLISGAAYGFTNFGTANLSTRIIDSLTFDTLAVGPITNVSILFSNVLSSVQPTLDAFGAAYGNFTNFRTPRSLGTLARYKINNPGVGYRIDDEIVFGPNPSMTFGIGAAAVVSNVSSIGEILTISSANSRIAGTVSIQAGLTQVAGLNTNFLSDLFIGQKIEVNREFRTVATIADNFTLDVTAPFATNALNKKLGVFNRYPKGGVGYVQNNFPSITVTSNTGSGASVEVDSIASHNDRLEAAGVANLGAITKIRIVSPGAGFQFKPIISATTLGSGTAVLEAQIESSYLSTPGRWTTSDSIISSTERKLAGRNYYVDYSYVISSQIEFYRYKQLLKQLLHPVGLINYASYEKSTEIAANNLSVTTSDVFPDLAFSGRVNVGNGSIAVTGTNTKFNIANSRGSLTVGSYINVNGESRKVNSIISNTSLITSSEINQILISNTGSGYSNSYVTFANGGGKITTLSIPASQGGSGYSDGLVLFVGADEAVPAIASISVYPSNGTINTISLSVEANVYANGLYSKLPTAIPASDPDIVLYANTITIANSGEGYSNGHLVFTGGGVKTKAFGSATISGTTMTVTGVPIGNYGTFAVGHTVVGTDVTPGSKIVSLGTGTGGNGTYVLSVASTVASAVNVVATRQATATVEVYGGALGNGAIRRITVSDPALYENNPSAKPNSEPNVVISQVTVTSVGNAHSNGVLTFSGGTARREATVTVEVYGTPTLNIANLTILDSGNNYINGFMTFSNTALSGNSANIRIFVHSQGAVGNATISGTTMTVTSFASGYGFFAGQSVSGNGIVTGTTITALGTGTGSTGTYTISRSHTISSEIVVTSVGRTGNVKNVVIQDAGSYLYLPDIIRANSLGDGNLRFTVGVNTIPANGSIRTVTIVDPGRYSTPPTAILNTAPISISAISPTTGTPILSGNTHSNGFIVFTGGDPVIPANASVEIYPPSVVGSNGVVRRVIVNNAGLYRTAPVATANSVPVSITQVLPIEGGTGYSNGFITFSSAASQNAIVQIIVNAAGSIVRTIIDNEGLYPNSSGVIITGTTGGGTGATFAISFNANTGNLAQFTLTTAANATYTGAVSITANSNVYTNAAFTINGVANVQTTANITVGFTGRNTAANASVEVYSGNGSIRSVTINNRGDYYYVPDIIVTSGGTYGSINITGTTMTVTGSPVAPVGNFRVGQRIIGSGITDGTKILSQGTGIGGNGTYNVSIFHSATATVNATAIGVDAILNVNTFGIFTQTANLQSATVLRKDPSIFISEDSSYDLVTEDNNTITTEF